MSYDKQVKNKFTLNEKISNIILIFLLCVRVLDQDLAVWVFDSNVPEWVAYWYNSLSYILTAIIIWLNKHRLASINVDKPFVYAVILSGAIYALHPSPNNIGVLVGITAGLIYWANINNMLEFKKHASYSKYVWLLLSACVLLPLVQIRFVFLNEKALLNVQIFFTAFLASLQGGLILNVFEELIFRGALWAYLQSLGLSEQASFYAQAFLFWIAHYKFLGVNPSVFWVATPLITILLGLLAWRSKSLTPSLIGHFLYNFIVQLLYALYY